MGNLILKEQSVSGFTAAPLNKIKIAYGNDDNLYRIDDANNAVVIGGGGGSQTLAQTLALGNTSGAYDILMNTTQRIGFKDGDNTYTTYLSNDITTAANRTVYLPLFDGQLAYHATGTPPTTNYVLKGTTNGAITSSSLIFDNGTNVGINKSNPTSPLDIIGKVSIAVSGSSNALEVRSFNEAVLGLWQDNNANVIHEQYSQFKQTVSLGGTLATTAKLLSAPNDWSIEFGNTTINNDSVNSKVVYKSGYNKFSFRNSVNFEGVFYDFTSDIPKVGIGQGTGTTTATLHVKGATSDDTAYALKVDNSTPSPLLYIANTINGQANGLNQGNGNLVMYYDTSGAGYAVLRSLNYNSVAFGTHATPYRIILGRDGGIDLTDRTFIYSSSSVQPIASITETLAVGLSNHGVNGSTSSMVVLNITMGAAVSGLGLFAIGATGQGGTTGNATMNFKYDPISYSGTVNSANNNYYRVAIGKSPSKDYRLEISGGTRIESDSYTTSAAVLELSSTTQGLLLPRMTSTQASAITAVNGLILYVTDTNLTFTSVGFWGYENGSWVKL